MRQRPNLLRIPGTPEALAAAIVALLPLLTALQSQSIHAAEWDRSGSISASSYFTDNFCLSPLTEESEVVGTLTPGVRLTGEGDRAEMNLDARVEFNTLSQSDVECPRGVLGIQRNNRESVIPSGRFTASTDVVKDRLFLEADAFAGLNPVNPFGPGASDGLNGRQNANVSYRWGTGFRYQDEYAQRVSSLLRYNYNEQYNTASAAFGDSVENRVEGELGMIPGTSRFLLSASGRYSEVEAESSFNQPAFTNTLASAEGRLTFEASDTWSFSAAFGEEFNDFLSDSDEIDGDYWDAGVRWTPNARVVVDVGIGERFFGDTPRAEISYRHKRSELSVSYLKTLVFPRNIRAPNATPGLDEGLEFPNDPVGGFDTPVVVGNTPVLTETFSLRYSFSARRTDFTVTARESIQTRTGDLSSAEFRGASIAVRRTLGPKLSLNTRLNWNESEAIGLDVGLAGQNADTWTADVSLDRRIARYTSVILGYRYTDRRSEVPLNEFQENRISLTLRHDFR